MEPYRQDEYDIYADDMYRQNVFPYWFWWWLFPPQPPRPPFPGPGPRPPYPPRPPRPRGEEDSTY